MILGTYDVVVIGAGHAGIEAAVAAVRNSVLPLFVPLQWSLM